MIWETALGRLGTTVLVNFRSARGDRVRTGLKRGKAGN